jgi:DNA-binding winged helix-turn-helix (wHTH) protein
VVLAFGGDLEFDPALFEVRRGGVRVPLEPQAFDVLAYLVSHRDRVVPKEELMDGVWGGRFVSETAVTSRIKQVRRALGDDGHSQRMIRTQHGRGYRFVAPVEVRAVPTPSATGSTSPTRSPVAVRSTSC